MIVRITAEAEADDGLEKVLRRQIVDGTTCKGRYAYKPLESDSIGLRFHRCMEVFARLLKGVQFREREFLDQLRPFAMVPSTDGDRQGDEELRLLRLLGAAGKEIRYYGDFERISYMIEHFVASEVLTSGEAPRRHGPAFRPVYQSPTGINWTRCMETYRRLVECVGSCTKEECKHFINSVLEFAMSPYHPWDAPGAEELRLLELIAGSDIKRRAATMYDHFERLAFMIEHYDAARQQEALR